MKEYLQETIQFIDDNITKNLNLDYIADHVGFSKYYLNQLFSIYTGFSIIEYTRQKKLEYAIDLLKTDKRIIDIALELGYSSERAFSRALKKAYGHSPSYFRNNTILKSRKLVIYDLALEINENTFYDYFPDTYKQVVKKLKKEGLSNIMKYLSDVNYVSIEPMTVISGIKKGSQPENEIVELMNELAAEYNLSPLRAFGFDSPVEVDQDPMIYRGYEFWLSLSKDDLVKLPSSTTFQYKDTEVAIKEIPKHRYATLRITDPFIDAFERIPGGWKALHSWLDEHDFKEPDFKPCTNAIGLEEVREINGITVMDIFAPIR